MTYTQENIAADAAERLADARAHRRLPNKPSPETLARIAAIILNDRALRTTTTKTKTARGANPGGLTKEAKVGTINHRPH
jgi:hypothetical protein